MHHAQRLFALILCLPILTGIGCYGLGEDIVAKLGLFVVTPTTGLETVEDGTSDTFTVALGRQPSADVVIGLSSSASGEAFVSSGPSLTFTNANWNVPQTVTVTGADDDDDNGDAPFTIVLAAAVSTDYHFNGLNPADVAGTNEDDDISGVRVTPTSGLSTSENLTSATFDVVLASRPTADVTIALSSSNTAIGTVSPTTMTFLVAEWDIPKTATVTGVDDSPDAVNVGGTPYTIFTGPVTSGDPLYSGIAVADVSVTNDDDDDVGVTVTPHTLRVTSEAGDTDTFTVVLLTVPSAAVVIDVVSLNPAEGLVSDGVAAPATSMQLTFLPGTWDTPQIVTLKGVDDAPNPVIDGDVGYTIQITTNDALTLDNTYDIVDPNDVTVTNTDDDEAEIVISQPSLTTIENGLNATFTIALATIPSADVTITIASSDTSEGTVSPPFLTFLANDPSALQPQTVTVTPVDDVDLDGVVSYSIVLTTDPTLDLNYDGLDPADVSVDNDDDDEAEIEVTQTAISTSETLTTATFSVRLKSVPLGTVTITLTGLDVSEGSLSDSVLTFNPGNATAFQDVTVTGVDDGLLDGNVVYTLTGTPSGDAQYSGLPPFEVEVTNNDDETTPPGAAPGPGTSAMQPSTPDAYDDKRVVEPSVIQTGPSAFTMWFEGSNATGPKREQVGLAAGTGPTTWVKDAASPVLSHSGDNGEIDKIGVGDPSVLLVAPGDYRMWFGCRENAAHKTKIAYATSVDGTAWTKHQLSNATVAVLQGSSGRFDATGTASPGVILDGGTYKMWYSGYDGSVWRIGYATSADGITWAKHGGALTTPVLNVGSPGSFDDGGASMPCVVKDGGTFRMWYIGRDDSGNNGVQRLGYATSSDGIVWTKFSGNPILDVGAPGSFSERNLWSPWVVKDGSLFHIWFGAENGAGLVRIAYTSSN